MEKKSWKVILQEEREEFEKDRKDLAERLAVDIPQGDIRDVAQDIVFEAHETVDRNPFKKEREALDTWFSEWCSVEEKVMGGEGEFDAEDEDVEEEEEEEETDEEERGEVGEEEERGEVGEEEENVKEEREIGKKSAGKSGGAGGKCKKSKKEMTTEERVLGILKAGRVEFGRLAGRFSDLERLVEGNRGADLREVLQAEADNLPLGASYPQAGHEGEWLQTQLGDIKKYVGGDSDWGLLLPILWHEVSKIAGPNDPADKVVKGEDKIIRLKLKSRVGEDGHRIWPCPYEGYVEFRRSSTGIDSHINKEHTNEVYKCDVCAWTHYNRDMFDNHVRNCKM